MIENVEEGLENYREYLQELVDMLLGATLRNRSRSSSTLRRIIYDCRITGKTLKLSLDEIRRELEMIGYSSNSAFPIEELLSQEGYIGESEIDEQLAKFYEGNIIADCRIIGEILKLSPDEIRRELEMIGCYSKFPMGELLLQEVYTVRSKIVEQLAKFYEGENKTKVE